MFSKTIFLALTVLVACVAAATADFSPEADHFLKWADAHGKKYESVEEFSHRFSVFQSNLRRIEELNAESKTATFIENKFADLTADEFKHSVLMQHRPTNPLARYGNLLESDPDFAAPTHFDWRAENAVTPVKNQGQCGSCWAFSVVENVESVWFLANHTMTELSVSQVVDCDNQDLGCNGGDPPTAYEYIIKAGGLESEKDYPYRAEDGKCKADPAKFVAHIKSWEYATHKQDEHLLAENLVKIGPLSVCVEADTWQFYNSGIVSSNCGRELDHCVQLVGYNTAGSKPFWIVRNSWGEDWGMKGYIEIEMYKDLCGIADEATSGVV